MKGKSFLEMVTVYYMNSDDMLRKQRNQTIANYVKRREDNMKKKFVSVLLAAVMTAALLTACGGNNNTAATAPASTAETAPAKEETPAPAAEDKTEDGAEEEQADDMVSDETFALLQENYAAMSECYDEVLELYSSDEIAADAEIEDLLTEAAEINDEMGEITQESITEEDAELLTEAMIEILNGLSALVEGMELADDGSGDMVSDENFAILQENYAALTEAYNAVVEVYSSDETEANADIENALNEAVEILEQMGTIEQESLTEADAQELNNAMMEILDALAEIAGAMG